MRLFLTVFFFFVLKRSRCSSLRRLKSAEDLKTKVSERDVVYLLLLATRPTQNILVCLAPDIPTTAELTLNVRRMHSRTPPPRFSANHPSTTLPIPSLSTNTASPRPHGHLSH